jgi:hypothetical protein
MTISTWDPAHRGGGSETFLSGGDLIITHVASGSSVWGTVISTTSHSSGKFYAEIVDTAAPDDGSAVQLGFSQFANINFNQFMSYAATNDGWVRGDMSSYDGSSDGIVSYTSANRGFTSLTSGDVFGLAIDFDAGKAWAIKNGDATQKAQAAAGTNPTWTWTPAGSWFVIYTSYTGGSAHNAVATLQTDTSNQSFAAPAGFVPWDGSGGGGFFARDYYDMIGRGAGV